MNKLKTLRRRIVHRLKEIASNLDKILASVVGLRGGRRYVDLRNNKSGKIWRETNI